MSVPRHIGTYEIERRLGGGGMAEVFLARVRGAQGFCRRVAIKRVLPGFAENPQFSSLFVTEAHVSARLSHPNVVSVLDFKHDPQHGMFLVMELVEGRDLAQLLATGLVPVSTCLFIVAETLRGLGYAHHLPLDQGGLRGVIHRDVSPHNVLLSWEGAVKVSDFGIAKVRAASNASASRVIKGKPAYMSPEQANGHPLDGRSDLFAAGVMLWEMLVGQHLFPGETVQETLAALFFAPIPSPRQMRADVPQDVAEVTMRLLARDPAARYPTAEAAIADLVACADAPRDGRAELSELLQQRFSGLSPVRPPERAASRPGVVRDPRATSDLATVRHRLRGLTPSIEVGGARTESVPGASARGQGSTPRDAAEGPPTPSAVELTSGAHRARQTGIWIGMLVLMGAGALTLALVSTAGARRAGSLPVAPPPGPTVHGDAGDAGDAPDARDAPDAGSTALPAAPAPRGLAEIQHGPLAGDDAAADAAPPIADTAAPADHADRATAPAGDAPRPAKAGRSSTPGAAGRPRPPRQQPAVAPRDRIHDVKLGESSR